MDTENYVEMQSKVEPWFVNTCFGKHNKRLSLYKRPKKILKILI